MSYPLRLLSEKISSHIEKRVYACPCGKGTISEEQDYTPGFRDGFAALHCEECETKYYIDFDSSQTKWSLKEKKEGELNMRNTIKQIVFEEFSRVVTNIESDFRSNYVRKRYNFLLSQLDENMTANMVFVSSFESKSGFAIEACAKRIARLRFGDENVPTIVNPHGLRHNIDERSISGQIIVTDVDTDDGNLRGEISAFRANNVASGSGRLRRESGVNQESIKEVLLPLATKYKSTTIHRKPVDLAFFDGQDWIILELKAGGDLDSSNAPSNVEKLLTIYTGLNMPNSKAYFGTLYNKDGEGRTWNGAVKKHMAYPEMFLIGKKFWEKILPDGITFEDFEEIYREALEDIDLNARVHAMIDSCSES